MNVAAGPELAAAVTNAGGLGVIGGVGYTPKFLRQQVNLKVVALITTGADSDWFLDQSFEKRFEGPKCTIWRRLVTAPSRR
jgi:hypothetical protein